MDDKRTAQEQGSLLAAAMRERREVRCRRCHHVHATPDNFLHWICDCGCKKYEPKDELEQGGPDESASAE